MEETFAEQQKNMSRELRIKTRILFHKTSQNTYTCNFFFLQVQRTLTTARGSVCQKSCIPSHCVYRVERFFPFAGCCKPAGRTGFEDGDRLQILSGELAYWQASSETAYRFSVVNCTKIALKEVVF